MILCAVMKAQNYHLTAKTFVCPIRCLDEFIDGSSGNKTALKNIPAVLTMGN
jgi:hypothetical protein